MSGPPSPPVDRKSWRPHRFVLMAMLDVKRFGRWRLTQRALLFISPPRSGLTSGATHVVQRRDRRSSCYRVTDTRRAAPRGIKTNEAYLSAFQTRPQAPAWLPLAHGNQGWSRRYRGSPQPWPQAAFRLSERRDRCRTTARPDFRLRKGSATGPNSWPSGVVKSAAGGFF